MFRQNHSQWEKIASQDAMVTLEIALTFWNTSPVAARNQVVESCDPIAKPNERSSLAILRPVRRKI